MVSLSLKYHKSLSAGQGNLQASRLPSLRTELLQFLLEVSDGQGQKSASTLAFGGAYRNLYYLLELDTEATLDVLKCSSIEYKSPEPDSSMAESGDANVDAKNENDLMAESETILIQNMIDALVHVLDNNASQTYRLASNDENESIKAWPSKKDIGYLFEFIAYYVACRRAKISKTVLNQILEYLTFENNSLQSISTSSTETSKRREKKLLALLEVVPETDWDQSYLLQLCENGGFYQVSLPFLFFIFLESLREHNARLDFWWLYLGLWLNTCHKTSVSCCS